ncbi:ATP synthase subunit I [Aeromonas diversa]|uniref:F0F1 ATP synthase subunit I n=1 Tax=Aeromonas diversa CDC 2478-85 TaxID=1268237 RepID=N9U1X1_9GAMM|nr:ATP synthase subunit I [Aeromonas diversa]ENY72369.1 F0F1 ATP synthase subunit I [Aeromonas diversa CDC 2478-85]
MVTVKQTWQGLRLGLVLLVIHLFLILVSGAVWYHFSGLLAGYSALIGGGIFWFPQLLYSLWVLGRDASRTSPGVVLWDFYVGAGIKLLCTVMLFVMVLVEMETDHLPLYVTYALSLFFQWVITIILNNRY